MAIPITPQLIRKKLFDVIHRMADDIEDFVRHPGHDFTRKRRCTFPRMLIGIMSMESHDLDGEILSTFTCGKKDIKRENLVTSSAFVQSRGKINDSAFPTLFHEFNQKFPFTKTKDGIHIFALDGSDVNVPADKKDCNTFIPYNSNKGGYHQMHINLCFSILDQRYTDVVIQPRSKMKEADAACSMVDNNTVKGKSLYIADRGYESFNLMAHIMEKGDYFLIRLKDVFGKASPCRGIAPGPDMEFDISSEFLITRSRSMKKQDPTKIKVISKNRRFDFIPEDDKKSTYRIPFRLVAIQLDTGTYEYLITNLPEKKYPASILKDYYHKRWTIETSFLFLKYGVALNYFHSIRRDFLCQEIYAKLIIFNFISLLVSCVRLSSGGNTKYTYKVSFSDAISTGRLFLLNNIRSVDVIPLLEFHKTPERPDRKARRKLDSQKLKTLQHRT